VIDGEKEQAMYLKHKTSHKLVEVLQVQELFDPCKNGVTGRYHAGEELQEPETFRKVELIFPSDEALPKCWLDPDYKTRH
jgi:hypothetical protein